MRRVMRVLNLLVIGAALASALAVLGSMLLVPGYREAYGDSWLFVLAYVALQGFVVREFWRDSPLVPWLALGRAVSAWIFLLAPPVVGLWWMRATPARYVYVLFDWGLGLEVVLFAFLWLGRGVMGTINALYFTAPWLQRLRARRPLVGRAVTAVALVVLVWCSWTFVGLLRVANLRDIAGGIWTTLDCETMHAKDGETTTDVRQGPDGKRRYTVRIAWGCPDTRVIVADENGRVATWAGERQDCCGASGR